MNKLNLKKLLIAFSCILLNLSASLSAQAITEEVDVRHNGHSIKVFSMSTAHPDSFIGSYSVANLFDGDKQTDWVMDSRAGAEWQLRVVFDKPAYVKEVRLLNGSQKSDHTYLNNQRVKSVYVNQEVFGLGGYYEMLERDRDFEDRKDWQTLELMESELFKISGIVLNVKDVYPSRKYDEVCIAELEIIFADEIPYSPQRSWDELKKIIVENQAIDPRKQWDWSDVLKRDPRNTNTYCYGCFIGGLENDLFYYALTGNQEAEKYYRSFQPTGRIDTEWFNPITKPAMDAALVARKSESNNNNDRVNQ